jgi:uncharacterized membrane protein
LRLNLVLLMVTSVLPFPTRLVAESLDDVSGERVFVTMYGLTLLGIRVLLYALDTYCQREHLYSPPDSEAAEPAEPSEPAGRALLPVLGAYGTAILIGLVLPWLAVGLYCLIAVVLVVPWGELRRLLFPSGMSAYLRHSPRGLRPPCPTPPSDHRSSPVP